MTCEQRMNPDSERDNTVVPQDTENREASDLVDAVGRDSRSVPNLSVGNPSLESQSRGGRVNYISA